MLYEKRKRISHTKGTPAKMGTQTSASARSRAFHLLRLLLFLYSVSIASAEYDEQDELIAAYFDKSRILQQVPQEGITLNSASASDEYLVNGETDDVISEFVFFPGSAATPDQYNMAYTCESGSGTVSTADTCDVNNVISTISGSTLTAYNTTVTCVFADFPGQSVCSLTATLRTTLRQDSGQSLDDSISERQQSVYTSQKVTTNVFGIVFYIPDSSGALSADATVISGISKGYVLNEYDRQTQGVREISSFGILPGGATATGTPAINFFRSATVKVSSYDQIFKFDPATCTLTNAEFLNSRLVLPNPGNCALGLATLSEDAYPSLGVQFRAYKSGNFTLQLSWNALGSSANLYEQVINFQVTKPAPPVLTAIGKRLVYRSTPCDSETLSVTGYNLRYADTRQLVVTNTDGTTTTWSQVRAGYQYDSATDTSVTIFESGGGSGTNVQFQVQGIYGTAVRIGIIISGANVETTVSFTRPPSLSAMNPSTSAAGGGAAVVLQGSFEGFSVGDTVYVGGHKIPGKDTIIQSTTQITFTSPALSDLGRAFVYPVSIGICAERSNSLDLSYEVNPIVVITSDVSATASENSYLIPASGQVSFVAEVSGNNDGMVYVWQIFATGGQEVNTGSIVTNRQIFTIPSEISLSPAETYSLQVSATNSLSLSATAEVTLRKVEAAVPFVFVNVFAIENVSRSLDTETLVQASVSVQNSGAGVNLEWKYLTSSYIAGESSNVSVSRDVTGPTRFGLEFNIARKDLVVGKETLQLIATLVDNPNITGSDSTKIIVNPSKIVPVVNDDINGTLVLMGNDLSLYAGLSYDPDVLKGEGDPRTGITYEWFRCVKALKPSFSSGVEDCTAVLSSGRTLQNITIPSATLLQERLDVATEPLPTYFSFGLRISKGTRVAEGYTYIELRNSTTTQKKPTLDSLEVTDSKGTVLRSTEVSIFGDIIIQPMSTDTSVVWAFDMVNANQRYLFSQKGSIKSGAAFVSTRGEKSRLPFGFVAGTLDAATEYSIAVTASAADTPLESYYEIKFTTAEVPTLTCTGPEVTTGIVSETSFTVSAQLSFEAQTTEYCFALTSSATERFAVGKGCSKVPFASFTFPNDGSYGVECVARTVSGSVIGNVTLDEKIVLSTPAPDPAQTEIEMLAARIANVSREADACQALKDHPCITSLISVARTISSAVDAVIVNNTSEAAAALFEATKAYIAKLVALSEELADNTVFRPNEVASAVDQSYYLSLIPESMFAEEGTLFSSLKQVAGAVNSTEAGDPVVSNELVDKVSATANLSLANAYNLVSGGTSRRRLLADTQVRGAYAAVLFLTSSYVGQIRAQQEGCGFAGLESTSLKQSLVGNDNIRSARSRADFEPVQVFVMVSCNGDQISVPMAISGVRNEICQTILSSFDSRRIVAVLTVFSDASLAATGLISDFESRVTHCPYLEFKGIGGDAIPAECIQISMPLKAAESRALDTSNYTAGTLRNPVLEPPNTCTQSKCFNFAEDKDDVVTFTDTTAQVVTSRPGLYIAGINGRAAVPEDMRIDGLQGRASGLAVGLTVGFAFVVVAGIVTWFTVTNGVLISAQARASAQQATAWEYVERDMFGRGALKEGGTLAEDGDAVVGGGAREGMRSSVAGKIFGNG